MEVVLIALSALAANAAWWIFVHQSTLAGHVPEERAETRPLAKPDA
jgi:hypothetical protein